MLLLLSTYKYILIFPLTIIEGPIVMMVSGCLVRLGFLDIIPAFICLVVADLLGDVIWYEVGNHFGHRFIKRFGKYVSVTEENVSLVTKIFHRHKNIILLISKITGGLGFSIATLITAGMVKIPFKKFITINLLGEIFWVTLFVFIGYFFGDLYLKVSSLGEKIFIIAGVIALVIILYGLSKYLRQKINKT